MTVTRLGRVTGEGGGLLRVAAVPFLATRLPLLLAGVLSVALLPVSRYVESYWLIKGLDRAFDAFSRWDAWHYTRIALTGYVEGDPSRTAFFPLFPTLIRILAELVGRTDRPGLFAAAVVVANIGLLLATMVLIALVRLDLDASDARRAAWYLLVFPTSLFLSAGYSESVFLLLTMGADPCLPHGPLADGGRPRGARGAQPARRGVDRPAARHRGVPRVAGRAPQTMAPDVATRRRRGAPRRVPPGLDVVPVDALRGPAGVPACTGRLEPRGRSPVGHPDRVLQRAVLAPHGLPLAHRPRVHDHRRRGRRSCRGAGSGRRTPCGSGC